MCDTYIVSTPTLFVCVCLRFFLFWSEPALTNVWQVMCYLHLLFPFCCFLVRACCEKCVTSYVLNLHLLFPFHCCFLVRAYVRNVWQVTYLTCTCSSLFVVFLVRACCEKCVTSYVLNLHLLFPCCCFLVRAYVRNVWQVTYLTCTCSSLFVVFFWSEPAVTNVLEVCRFVCPEK